jgi:hypothetical protein
LLSPAIKLAGLVNIFEEIPTEQVGKMLNSLYTLTVVFNEINKITLEYDYAVVENVLFIMSVVEC